MGGRTAASAGDCLFSPSTVPVLRWYIPSAVFVMGFTEIQIVRSTVRTLESTSAKRRCDLQGMLHDARKALQAAQLYSQGLARFGSNWDSCSGWYHQPTQAPTAQYCTWKAKKIKAQLHRRQRRDGTIGRGRTRLNIKQLQLSGLWVVDCHWSPGQGCGS